MTLDRPLARPEPSRPEASHRGGLAGRLRLPLAVLIGAVPFAMHAWSALHGYFWQDDFIITYRAARANPLDLGYVFQAYNNEHLAPGMFLMAWLVTAIAPLSYPIAVLPLLVMQAAAVVLFWRLLVRCFGERWGILPPFAVFAAAPLILLPTLWWSYGVQLIPLLLAMAGALNAHVRYLREGRHPVRPFLWTAFGMAFYEKAALIPALLFAVTVLLAADEPMAAVRRHARLWLAHAGLVGAYAVLYLSVTSTTMGGDGTTRFTELADRLLLDTFLPGLFGGPLGGAGGGVSWLQPALATRVLAVVLALGVVVAGLVRTGRRAGLAWLLLAGYLAVDLLLLALTRLHVTGTLAGADPRYIADAVPVAVLFATFAVLAPGARRVPRPAAVAVAVLTVAFLANATVSYLRLAPAAQARHAREYVATAAAGLAANPGIVLYDGRVPDDILINWFGPDAGPSRVIGLLADPPRFDEPAETLYLLDESGQPRPIERLDNAVAAVAGTAPDCGHAVTEEPTEIALSQPVRGTLLARVEYYTAAGGAGWISVAGETIQVDFERGVHVLHVPVAGAFDALTFRRATPVAAVCVTKVLVGEPVV